MKKLIVIIAVLMGINVLAQSPESINYQTVIRDANNELVTSQMIGMRISILQGSPAGVAVHIETQTLTTNSNGLEVLKLEREHSLVEIFLPLIGQMIRIISKLKLILQVERHIV